MTKDEFIEGLRHALSGRLSASSVEENVRYYENYIIEQVRSGQDETQVIASLGDPRLLAKTIMNAQGADYVEYGSGADRVYTEEEEIGEKKGFIATWLGLPSWLKTVILVVVSVFVVAIVWELFKMLLPIVIPVVIVLMLIRLFKEI